MIIIYIYMYTCLGLSENMVPLNPAIYLGRKKHTYSYSNNMYIFFIILYNHDNHKHILTHIRCSCELLHTIYLMVSSPDLADWAGVCGVGLPSSVSWDANPIQLVIHHRKRWFNQWLFWDLSGKKCFFCSNQNPKVFRKGTTMDHVDSTKRNGLKRPSGDWNFFSKTGSFSREHGEVHGVAFQAPPRHVGKSSHLFGTLTLGSMVRCLTPSHHGWLLCNSNHKELFKNMGALW